VQKGDIQVKGLGFCFLIEGGVWLVGLVWGLCFGLWFFFL